MINTFGVQTCLKLYEVLVQEPELACDKMGNFLGRG